MTNRTTSLVVAIVAAVLGPALGAQGAVVRYVSSTGSGAGGQTWTTAYRTIQAALDDAQMVAGGEIHVKSGVYNITQPIQVKKAVLVYGGYNGSGDTRDWTTYQTTVDGGSTSTHCFVVTANATIDGFGIFNGAATGNGSDANGGGVNVLSCAATINNCIFKYNDAAGVGGGIATYRANGTHITNCSFVSNKCVSSGAGIYNDTGIGLQITNCTFTTNVADDSAGGVYNFSSTVTVTDCMFEGNTASVGAADANSLGAAGGLMNDESPATITGCVFTGNKAPYGAGIFNFLSSPTINGCLFESCSPVTLSGGGVCSNGGAPTIKNSLFQSNSVRYTGGGLYTTGAVSKVIDCVFLGNTASSGGGGIYIAVAEDGSTTTNPQFINCTLYANGTAGRGGGVYCESTPGTFLNCIIWGNTANAGGPGIYATTAGKPAVQYSDVQGTSLYAGTGNKNADPRLIDPVNWNFGLAFDSPCIDTGSNLVVAGITTDYEDAPRIVDGNGDGSAIVDMGACEVQGSTAHLRHGEIQQTIVYDNPATTTPTYVFMLRMQTDGVLTSVQFQAPNGTTYTIPADASKKVGTVETYHTASGNNHTWEYWDTSSSSSVFSSYGDGVYHVIGNYRDGSKGTTDVSYSMPNSTTPLPRPTEKPNVTAPLYGGNVTSPLAFQWADYTDAAVNKLSVTVFDANDKQVASKDVNATARLSDGWTLQDGTYNAEIAFGDTYDVSSTDGTPFVIGKSVLVGYTFTVNGTAVYEFVASAVDGHFLTISAAAKDKVLSKWPDYWTYKGIVFNACSKQVNTRLAPVYRFWSGSYHFFTLDAAERAVMLRTKGWVSEGIAFYAYPAGKETADCKAVYRFYNKTTKSRCWTMNDAEVATLTADPKYLYEGIAFYAYPP